MKWSRRRRLILFLVVSFLALLASLTLFQVVLVPIGISLLLTYLLLPLADFLEHKLRLGRDLASAVIITALVALVIVAGTFAIPVLYHEGLSILTLVPQAIDYVVQGWLPLIRKFVFDLHWVDVDAIQERLTNIDIVTHIATRANIALQQVWSSTPLVLGGVINAVLIPVVTFFCIRDIHASKRTLMRLIPTDMHEVLINASYRVDATLRSVIKGQVTVAIVDGILYMIGLSIVGLRFSLVIGAVAGLCRIVPYLDVFVGLALSGIVMLTTFSGWGQFLAVVLVFLIVQSIDGLLITPRVIGDRVGLHPLLVILSVYAFGDWFGFYGVFLAVPVVAIAKVLVELCAPVYWTSPLFLDSPPDEQRN